MKKILAGLSFLIMASWSLPASAVIMTYTDRTTFNNDIAGLVITNDSFSNSISNGLQITFDSGVISTMTGSSAGLSDSDCNRVSGGNFDGRVDGNASSCSQSIDWAFPGSVIAIGFDISGVSSSSSRDLRIVLTDGSALNIDVRPFLGGSSGFIGFVGMNPIASFQFVNLLNSSDGFSVDDLTFADAPAAAPEPGVLALIGIGLAGLGFVGRRRKTA